MALSPGTRLGPYEILAPLGAGGMGEVYRARDTRLGRDVAVKVLTDELADDPKALARFQAEARAVAALSHPNILALHDVGEEGGVRYAVTELLEGTTLREPLKSGALPFRRALEIAGQIADGLAAAHDKGIVHRDVKPENVFLTKDGHAKILDFGLARQRPPLPSSGETNSPTLSALTDAGTVLGTFAYMSPEQASGNPVDHRSDQFSLGVVLYEMLTGKRPFGGATAAETLTAIIREDPEPLEAGAPKAPAPVRWLVERLLSKDPHGRYVATRDLAQELASLRAHLPELSSGGTRTSVDGAPRGRTAGLAFRVSLAAAAAVALLAAGRLLERHLAQEPAPRSIPKLVRLTWEPGRKHNPSVSPDGNTFAYSFWSGPAVKSDILVRRIGGENPINLTKDCPEEDSMPAFSPDGQSIAFRSDREGGGIFVIGATGESVRRLTDFGFEPAWSPDGRTIAFSTRSPGDASAGESELWIVDVATGVTKKLCACDAEHPAWSPSGSRIAFHRRIGERLGMAVSTVAVSGGPPTNAVEQTGSFPMLPTWTRGGIWFASSAGGIPNIWRVRVDEATGKPAGAPEQVVTSTNGTASPTWTADGRRLLFASFNLSWGLLRYGFDPQRGGVLPESRVVLSGPREIQAPQPSPDGEWLATILFEGDIQDLLLVRSSTGESRRLTHDALREDYVAWAPDGATIYFCVAPGEKSEVWSMRSDGSGRQLVVASPGQGDVLTPLPSPDGRRMYVEVGKVCTPSLVDLGVPPAQRRPVPLPPMSQTRMFRAQGWSPDGRWLAGYPYDGALKADSALTLYDVERKSYRKLADLEAANNCAWLPDSRRILLFPLLGKTGVRVVDRETGAITPAGTIGEDIQVPALSRDGLFLVGDTLKVNSDIWMLDYGR